MKKYIGAILAIVYILVLTGCGKKERIEIRILIPAGSTAEFVYSDEEILPTGNKITILTGEGLGDTEVILKPVNPTLETGFVAEYITPGLPVEFDTTYVTEEWFQVGVSVQNDSAEPMEVSVEADGVEVRITERAEENHKTIIYNGKEYKKSELCRATLQWLELSVEERMFSSYLPPEFMEWEENWGITLTAENVTPTGITLVCNQYGGEATGELQTGSWYIIENWTQENGWKEVLYIEVDAPLTWTEEAWMIPKGDIREWEVNWEHVYGKLPEGKYRIGKKIMDFRGSGDYDEAVYFAEFQITK